MRDDSSSTDLVLFCAALLKCNKDTKLIFPLTKSVYTSCHDDIEQGCTIYYYSGNIKTIVTHCLTRHPTVQLICNFVRRPNILHDTARDVCLILDNWVCFEGRIQRLCRVWITIILDRSIKQIRVCFGCLIKYTPLKKKKKKDSEVTNSFIIEYECSYLNCFFTLQCNPSVHFSHYNASIVMMQPASWVKHGGGNKEANCCFTCQHANLKIQCGKNWRRNSVLVVHDVKT